MDPYCVAGIRGRGPHKMKKKVEYWKHTDPMGMKYGGELDIRHCFPETPHQFIKFGYRQLIKDRYWLSIADKIVDSFRHGLPIGYVTSHWFQNLIAETVVKWYFVQIFRSLRNAENTIFL